VITSDTCLKKKVNCPLTKIKSLHSNIPKKNMFIMISRSTAKGNTVKKMVIRMSRIIITMTLTQPDWPGFMTAIIQDGIMDFRLDIPMAPVFT
jgi:hypothetical protein